MLKFIGNGSAFNTELGNTSAYWKNNKIMFLIDCGESIFKTIKDKYLLDDIEEINILISHLHFDHIGSLSTLIYYCYFVKKIKVNIFYPDKDLDIILKLSGHQTYEYNFYQENALTFGDLGNILFHKTNHIDKSNAYGIEINIDNKSIYYSGDTKDVIDYTDSKYDIIYQDVSNYANGVHTFVDDFIKVNKDNTKIVAMHFDCKETILKCISGGINISKVEI